MALLRGEVDARAKNADSILTRNLAELQKGLLKVHVAINIPRGKAHPRFADVPEIEAFARNETDRQLLNLFRTFLYPRWPYFLPPATPPDIVKTLREAMAKAFSDPEFPKGFKKLMGSNPNPLTRGRVRDSDPGTTTRPPDGRTIQEARRRRSTAHALT